MCATKSKWKTISREVLGHKVGLGYLYDVTTEQFCGTSIFSRDLPPNCKAITDISGDSKISLRLGSSHEQKCRDRDVSSELLLSDPTGVVGFGASAKYLSQKKKGDKSVECTLICNIKTVNEHLNLFFDDVRACINERLITDSRATHVVIDIEWGANYEVNFTDRNCAREDKMKVEGTLKAQVGKLISGSGGISVSLPKEESEGFWKFKLEISGDVKQDGSDELPHTEDEVLAYILKVPKLIQNENERKGKPLKCDMLPVSCLVPQNLRESLVTADPLKLVRDFRNVSEAGTLKVLELFDLITELKHKVCDQVQQLINDHSDYVTSSELSEAQRIQRELEVQEGEAKDDLKLGVEKTPSKEESGSFLNDFYDKHSTAANAKFDECSKIYKALQARIEFIKRCEKFFAKYLTPPVDQRIASACDDYDNVYVLFHGDADDEIKRKNEKVFIELAKVNMNESKTACYITLSEESENRIEHYRYHKLVHKNVAEHLEGENVAMCVPAAMKAFRLMPFKVRCPGSYDRDCKTDDRSWTCATCKETLEFCPVDSKLYCHCGQSSAKWFHFRCRSATHGSHFSQFKDDTLQKALDYYKSNAPSGDLSGKLLIKFTAVNVNMFNNFASFTYCTTHRRELCLFADAVALLHRGPQKVQFY